MKAAVSKEIIKDVVQRGYVLINDTYYPPNSQQALKFALEMRSKPKSKTKVLKSIKTGWIDDSRNLKNKTQLDMFTRLIKIELGLDVWPEFYFDTERLYRFDYAIPVLCDFTELKLAIEVQGGIWAKGNSGHSSGKGIQRDMDKSTLANLNGWTLIQVTPGQLMTKDTIDMIKKAINNLVR